MRLMILVVILMVVSVLSITFLGKSGNGGQTESANIESHRSRARSQSGAASSSSIKPSGVIISPVPVQIGRRAHGGHPDRSSAHE